MLNESVPELKTCVLRRPVACEYGWLAGLAGQTTAKAHEWASEESDRAREREIDQVKIDRIFLLLNGFKVRPIPARLGHTMNYRF